MRTWLTLLFLLAALPAAQAGAPDSQEVAPATARTFHEQLIGEITAGSSFKGIRISGSHIAWVEGLEGKQTVRLDGKSQGGTYDDVRSAAFSPGAAHFVFLGKRGSSWMFVLDGHEQRGQYDEVKNAMFTPGAAHFVFFGKRGSSWMLVLDGHEQPERYDDVKDVWSRRGVAHFAFFGKRGSSWMFVLDGHEQPEQYDKASPVSFAPQGDSYAFVACQAKKCQLNVAGTKSGPVYDDFSYPQYSNDGKKVAFLGKRDGKWFAVVNGKEQGPGLESAGSGDRGFTDDGSRFYFAGRLNGKWTYIVDGEPGPGFGAISPIAFSPDHQHYAYGGAVVKGGALRKKKALGTVVVDGKPGETHEGRGMGGSSSIFGFGVDRLVMAHGVRYLDSEFCGISTPQFTATGKIVYTVRLGKKGLAVMVGNESGPVFQHIISRVAVSRDSSQFVYIAVRKGEFQEVRNHQVVRNFSLSKIKRRLTGIPWTQSGLSRRIGISVPWIRMSRDGTHLAYEIVSGGDDFAKGLTFRALRCVVIDGKPGPEYDAKRIGAFDTTRDAKHYLYEVIGASGNKDLVNVDGLESALYDDAWALHFSDDEKEATFIAHQGGRLLRVTLPLD